MILGSKSIREVCKNKKVRKVVPGPLRGWGTATMTRGTTLLFGFSIKMYQNNKRNTL